MNLTLAPGYTHRPPTEDDIPAIIAVMNAFDTFFLGHSDDYTPDDIRNEDWAHLNLETDAWVFLAPDGGVVGYGTETSQGYGQLQIDGYTHQAPSTSSRGRRAPTRSSSALAAPER